MMFFGGMKVYQKVGQWTLDLPEGHHLVVVVESWMLLGLLLAVELDSGGLMGGAKHVGQ